SGTILPVRGSDQRCQAIELFARRVGNFDAAGALRSNQSHPGRQRRPQLIFDGCEIGGPSKPSHRTRALLLNALLCRAYGPRVGEDFLPQLELFARRRQSQQSPRMTHRETPFAQIRLDQRRKLEEAETVGDAASVASNALS